MQMTKRSKRKKGKKGTAVLLSEKTGQKFRALQEETGKDLRGSPNPGTALAKRLAKGRKKLKGENINSLLHKRLHA